MVCVLRTTVNHSYSQAQTIFRLENRAAKFPAGKLLAFPPAFSLLVMIADLVPAVELATDDNYDIHPQPALSQARKVKTGKQSILSTELVEESDSDIDSDDEDASDDEDRDEERISEL